MKLKNPLPAEKIAMVDEMECMGELADTLKYPAQGLAADYLQYRLGKLPAETLTHSFAVTLKREDLLTGQQNPPAVDSIINVVEVMLGRQIGPKVN